ncbi:MAG: pantetheine-phosphate adenylyltransferase [Candidatus Ranarchaeia archaeon]
MKTGPDSKKNKSNRRDLNQGNTTVSPRDVPFQYDQLIFSGTFDRLHKGHKHILRRAFSLARFVLIGITSDKMVETKQLSHLIQPVKVRIKELEMYLDNVKCNNRYEIKIIEDPMGFATAIEKIDAILVSEEPGPFKWAKRINRVRGAKGWVPLEIITIPFIKSQARKRISSLAIRRGKINREGIVIQRNPLRKKIDALIQKHLVLPVSLRETLRTPFGKLITDGSLNEVTKLVISQIQDNDLTVIAVGDVITQQLDKQNYQAHIYFIDFKTKREGISKYIPKSEHLLSIRNPPGEITPEAWTTLQIALDTIGSSVVVVTGEEDLLVLPAILLAPLGSVILYGQPDEGVVLISVDETLQKKILLLLGDFVEINEKKNNTS